MEHSKFRKILDELVLELTQTQFETLQQEVETRRDGSTICRLIERQFEKDRKCRRCSGERIRRCGKRSGLQRWSCTDCGCSFNALTGTPLARLRHKERWLGYMRSLIDALSVRKAARQSKISTNTSFRWRHRMVASQIEFEKQVLKGIGEVDETFFLESFKGQRKLPRAPRKRGGKAKKRGLSKEQIPVLIARDRHGRHIDAVLPDRSEKAVTAVLSGWIAKDSMLCTEKDPAIIGFARNEGVECKTFVASKGERVRGAVHVQNVNGYISRLKTWMRRFNGVATKYLPSYIGWRRMLDLRQPSLTPESCLVSALS